MSKLETVSPKNKDSAGTVITGDDSKKVSRKKKRLLVRWLCVVVALIAVGCIVFFATAGKSRKAEDAGIVTDEYAWTDEAEGASFYYEFTDDGIFRVTVGSIECESRYEEKEEEGKKLIGVDVAFGSFRSKEEAGYAEAELSKASAPGERTLTCSYGDEQEFTLKQAKKELVQPELPENFSPENELLGIWNFHHDSETYQFVFHDEGSMEWILSDKSKGFSLTYHGAYTVADGVINFTYFNTEKTVVPMNYSLDGDHLFVMGSDYLREGAKE